MNSTGDLPRMNRTVRRSPVAYTELLYPAEVAEIYKVNVKTVTAWADAGNLRYIRTIGGHRRYPADQFKHLRETP